MPLTITTAGIKDGKALWLDVPEDEGGGKRLNGTTYALGLMSISAGFNEINRNNVFEIFRRITLTEHHYGASRGNSKEPVYFTFEEVARHVGMRTNAVNMTDLQFDKKMRELWVRDLKSNYGKRVADDNADWSAG